MGDQQASGQGQPHPSASAQGPGQPLAAGSAFYSLHWERSGQAFIQPGLLLAGLALKGIWQEDELQIDWLPAWVLSRSAARPEQDCSEDKEELVKHKHKPNKKIMESRTQRGPACCLEGLICSPKVRRGGSGAMQVARRVEHRDPCPSPRPVVPEGWREEMAGSPGPFHLPQLPLVHTAPGTVPALLYLL